MKAVIKFTNSSGEPEYYAPSNGGYSKFLLDAQIYDYEDDAFNQIHTVKLNKIGPEIWNTAIVQPVRIVEV